jgi:hypothetical protein
MSTVRTDFHMQMDHKLQGMSKSELAAHYSECAMRLGRDHPYSRQVASELGKKSVPTPPVQSDTPPGPTPTQPVYDARGNHVGFKQGTANGNKAFVVTDKAGAVAGFADTDDEAAGHLATHTDTQDVEGVSSEGVPPTATPPGTSVPRPSKRRT